MRNIVLSIFNQMQSLFLLAWLLYIKHDTRISLFSCWNTSTLFTIKCARL